MTEVSLSRHVQVIRRTLSELLGPSYGSLSKSRDPLGMTLTTLITVNAALGAAVIYALHHLLAHGIRTDRLHLENLARAEERELDARAPERIAA